MPRRLRVLYSSLTAGLLLIPAGALYRELSQRSDIWWTPPAMALSLAASRDRVEMYVQGRPFDTLVEQGKVSITEGARPGVLSPQDIGLRFNNWDRVRVQRLPSLLLYAAALGAGAAMFLVIATGRLAYRGDRGASAA